MPSISAPADVEGAGRGAIKEKRGVAEVGGDDKVVGRGGAV